MPKAGSNRHDHAHEPELEPAALRAPGRRLTRQRRLIWEVLAADPDDHLDAEAIATRVQDRMPRVNASTVYRTLDLLVGEGLVRRTDLGADRAFYEPVHEHPHHHLVCTGCGSVAHVHDNALGDLRQRIDVASGFKLGEGEITFFGLCSDCRA